MNTDKKLQMENDLKKTISKNLKILMENSNIKNYELADKIGVSESTVGKWLLMKSLPKMGTVEKLAIVFGVNKSDILEDKDIGAKEPKNNYELTKRDERDIAKKLNSILSEMNSSDAFMFDGEEIEMDEESKELIAASIENSLRIAKRLAKEKYTPKKYKK